jgi:hypothetical protein
MRTLIALAVVIALSVPAQASHKKHHLHPMIAGLGIGLIYMLRYSRAHHEGDQWGQGKFSSNAPCSEQGCR